MQHVQVRPTQGSTPSAISQWTRTKKLATIGAWLYLLFTAGCCIYYLSILKNSVANDFWWQNFNTTGDQTFLGDLFNSKLILDLSGSVDLLDDTSIILKNYAASVTFVDMRPTAVRRRMLDQIPLETAIITIRKNTFYENVYTIIPYCWVDFGRQFELAHTAKRQERCLNHMQPNAALYLESLLRNVGTSDIVNSAFGMVTNQTVLFPLQKVPNGAAWVENFYSRKNMLSVSDEAALWRQNGLVYYAIQYQNRFQYGIENSLTIVNALGVHQNMKISSLPYVYRGLASWTTGILSAGLWNDLSVSNYFKGSLLRNSNISLNNMGIDWDIDYYYPSANVPKSLFRQYIGPLSNFDVHYIAVPTTLLELYKLVQKQILSNLKANTLLVEKYLRLPVNMEFLVSVMAWSSPDIAFYTGSPLCPKFMSSTPYPLMPFSFQDSCQSQERFSISLQRNSLLFSIIGSNELTVHDQDTICSQASDKVACKAAILQTQQLFVLPPEVKKLANEAKRAIQSLNISFMQAATGTNATHLWLTQSILDPNDISLSFLGWVTLYDWVDGHREVLEFEGDVGNITLMSGYAKSIDFAANPLELPRKACFYFWYVVVYTTVLACFVAMVLISYGISYRFRKIESVNLFQFNRVFGSVWIGRPLMFMRGMTAIVILSTSTARLVSEKQVVTYYVEPIRPILETLLLSGESLWISYVIHDIFMPWTKQSTKQCAIMSSCTVFLTTLILELLSPVHVIGNIDHACTYTSFRRGVVCTSGTVEVGSIQRVAILFLIQLVVCMISVFAYHLHNNCSRFVYPTSRDLNLSHHLILPAAAVAFFNSSTATSWQLDAVSCAMSGLLPFRGLLFDLKLWSLYSISEDGCKFQRATFRLISNANFASVSAKFDKRHVWLSLLGLLYMAASIAGCYTYLRLTWSSLSNDFWWSQFDTDLQIYISNWFNKQLQLTNSSFDVDITSPTFGAMVSSTNQTPTMLSVSTLYANFIQNEANSLVNVIQSLRTMDGCRVPWLMTSYCFVDWKQRWEMAKSSKRQERCHKDKDNGAIYLEGVLQNVDWDSFQGCWGDALQLGLVSELQLTKEGQDWYNSISLRKAVRTILEEVSYWKTYGITKYVTQWQNYKTLGVIESFTVQNAFGIEYPLTIKYSNASFHAFVQNSFKMTWPLALDLMAITSNTSASTNGSSLIRRSSQFMFASQQILDVFLDKFNVMRMPVGPGLILVENHLGPFGTIDMQRVSPPKSLVNLYDKIGKEIMTILTSSRDTQQEFWSMYSSFTFRPMTNALISANIRGGDVFCDIDPGLKTVGVGKWVLFSAKGACSTYLLETLVGDTVNLLRGLLSVNNISLAATARLEVNNPVSSTKLFTNVYQFLIAKCTPMSLQNLRRIANQVKLMLRNDLQICITQFIDSKQASNIYELSIINLFDPRESDFELYSWLYMFDWVQGTREVVRFQGDKNDFTLLSTVTIFDEISANVMEIPFMMTYYMQILLQYITFVMLAVACVICAYILVLRGYIEAGNMTSFGRITSLVWIGRPLIFLRALCAVCVLSTSSLQLVRPLTGLVSYLADYPQPWYTVILAAGELNWLVYIINDVFSVWTSEFTHGYSSKSFILVWTMSALWEYLVPNKRSITINRVCTLDELDFQVLCRSGTINIGNFNRFCAMIGSVFVCCVVSYLFERYRRVRSKKPETSSSLFLYAAAKHHFQTSKWKYEGVNYVDKASAVLTGLLSVEYQDTIYLFDVKSWRLFQYPSQISREKSQSVPKHIVHAIPLLE